MYVYYYIINMLLVTCITFFVFYINELTEYEFNFEMLDASEKRSLDRSCSMYIFPG